MGLLIHSRFNNDIYSVYRVVPQKKKKKPSTYIQSQLNVVRISLKIKWIIQHFLLFFFGSRTFSFKKNLFFFSSFFPTISSFQSTFIEKMQSLVCKDNSLGGYRGKRLVRALMPFLNLFFLSLLSIYLSLEVTSILQSSQSLYGV